MKGLGFPSMTPVHYEEVVGQRQAQSRVLWCSRITNAAEALETPHEKREEERVRKEEAYEVNLYFIRKTIPPAVKEQSSSR